MMSYRDFKGGMRPGQNKRSRNRNNGGGGGHPNANGNGNRPRMPHRIQTYDSSGPNVKIRGNAYQVFERYIALAREAATAGDRIAAENLYQHAEHYFRIMNAEGQGNPLAAPRPMTPADTEMSGMDGDGDSPQGQPGEGENAGMNPSSDEPENSQG
jgi:hypothetical protein